MGNMTYLLPPITNTRPACFTDIRTTALFITNNKELQCTTEKLQCLRDDIKAYRKAKLTQLPTVLPAGVFLERRADALCRISNLMSIDLDGLADYATAKEVRDTLFHDRMLNPALAFISPSGRGVKLFVPYRSRLEMTIEECYRAALEERWAWIRSEYHLEPDTACSDIARGCLLCHDAEAKSREVSF